MPARESRGVHVELGLVLPVGQPNPLQRFLVVAIERIGNQLVSKKIHLHQAWDLGVVPLFNPGMAAAVEGVKLPAGMKEDRARGQGERWDGSEHTAGDKN